MLPVSLPPHQVSGAIQMLVRSFRPLAVTITRVTRLRMSAAKTVNSRDTVTIYAGEALVVPAGGMVQFSDIGVYEQKTDHLLVPGSRDIRQGDRVVLDNRTFEVDFAKNVWRAYVLVILKQIQQGT